MKEGISMNTNLNKYLNEVFRKEVKDPIQSHSEIKEMKHQHYLHDQRKNHFVLDSKYALRLDEII
jgi:Tfp pilus assembly protein PilP